MVFIRPTILRDSIQASFETDAKYQFIRDLQLEQADRPVPLLRGTERPLLPELVSPAEPAVQEPQSDGG